MSTVPQSDSMAQESQGNNSVEPEIPPVKRKRGRPRKDDVPASELSPRTQQRQRTDPSASSSHCLLVGQAVSGILDGAFDAGYQLTVRVGTTGPVFRGVVFDPRRCVPVSAVNDIAPHLPMFQREEVASPSMAEASSQEVFPMPTQPAPHNAIAIQTFQRNELANPTTLAGRPTEELSPALQQTGRSLCTSKSIMLKDESCALQPDSKHPQTIINTTTNVNPSPSAVHLPSVDEARSPQELTPILVKDEEYSLLVQASGHQIGEGTAAPEGNVDSLLETIAGTTNPTPPASPKQLQSVVQNAFTVLKEEYSLPIQASCHQMGKGDDAPEANTDSQLACAAGNANTGLSAATKTIQSGVQNTQAIISERPPAVVKEELLYPMEAADNQVRETDDTPNEDANLQLKTAAVNADPGPSVAHQSLRSDVQDAQAIIISEQPPAVVKEEEDLLAIQASGPKTVADSQQMECSSDDASRTALILKGNEAARGMPISGRQTSQHQALTAKCMPEPEDSLEGSDVNTDQLNHSRTDPPQALASSSGLQLIETSPPRFDRLPSTSNDAGA